MNGERIGAPTLLSPGDGIELGGTTLAVVAPSAEPAAPAAPPERRPALRVLAGFSPGALVHVGDQPVTLGRTGPGAKALGGDPAVAEEHLRASVTRDGRLLVEDLGSPSGTVFQGTRIGAPTLLSPGDRLQVGGTTLEVVTAAALPGGAGGGVSGALGGVRRVPEGLFSRIAIRAPVTVQDVIPVFLLSLGWAFAANLLVRTVAIDAFDVRDDFDPLVVWELLLATFFPVAGNSVGFFMSFRRPDDRSVFRYMIPTLGLPLFFIIFNLARIEQRNVEEVITTVALVIIPVAISAPLMVRLRAKVARERVGAVRGV